MRDTPTHPEVSNSATTAATSSGVTSTGRLRPSETTMVLATPQNEVLRGP